MLLHLLIGAIDLLSHNRILVHGVSEIKLLVSLQNLEVSVWFWIKTAVSVSTSKPSKNRYSTTLCLLSSEPSVLLCLVLWLHVSAAEHDAGLYTHIHLPTSNAGQLG